MDAGACRGLRYHVAMQTDANAIAINDGVSGLGARFGALLLALACAVPLIFAATLTPSDAGMGTHMQVGLPDCGFKLATGYPCATCG